MLWSQPEEETFCCVTTGVGTYLPTYTHTEKTNTSEPNSATQSMDRPNLKSDHQLEMREEPDKVNRFNNLLAISKKMRYALSGHHSSRVARDFIDLAMRRLQSTQALAFPK